MSGTGVFLLVWSSQWHPVTCKSDNNQNKCKKKCGFTYVRGLYLGLLAGSSTPPLLCSLLLFRRDCPLVAHVCLALQTWQMNRTGQACCTENTRDSHQQRDKNHSLSSLAARLTQ